MAELQIPNSDRGVTSAWLTTALRHVRLLDAESSATITEKETLKGGRNGPVLRLKVSYTGTYYNLPASFVVKLAIPRKGDNSNEKELYFYKNVGCLGLVPVFRAPRTYLATKSGSIFLFLEEDLGNLKQIPQQEGADYETTKRIVVALAIFHAKYWDSSPNALEKLRKSFCPCTEAQSHWETIKQHLDKSIDEFADLVKEEEISKTARFCQENFAQLIKKSQTPPCTLTHGDPRLANLFLEGEECIVATNWESFSIGSGPGELGYFLSMNVQDEVRKRHETEFLHLYLEVLKQHGVTDFTFEECYRKYIVGIACACVLPIVSARGIVEGRKHHEHPSSNPELQATASPLIDMYNNIKPMVDLWCCTARMHPITSIHLDTTSV